MMDFLGKNHHLGIIFLAYQLELGFLLVYELSCPDRKKFWTIFIEMGNPYQKKTRIFFLNQVWQFIHQAIRRPFWKSIDWFIRF